MSRRHKADISTKKTYSWPTDTRKDASQRNVNQRKLQRDITSHLAERLLSTTTTRSPKTNAGEDIE